MSAQSDLVLRKLEGVKPAGQDKWMAKCPAHDDRQASLSIALGTDGRVLLNCHAGCATEAIVENVELALTDLFPPREDARPQIVAQYPYRDEKGALLFEVVRFSPKGFRQRRKTVTGWEWNLEGVRRPLYRLPELLAACDATVWIAEGEKDCDRLAGLGLVATTNVGGAGKWRPEYTDTLRGRDVVILPDNDEPGRKHAIEVATALTRAAKSVRVLAVPGIPAKGDVSDWVSAGGDAVQLRALAAAAPIGIPKPHNFKPSMSRLKGEREDRLLNSRSILSFGVRYLDDALGGITIRDLVLYGAQSGVGKTALATITSLATCRAGKRAHYFALEAEEREIERRMKFQVLAELYYGSPYHKRPIRFQDWYNGRLENELGPFEDAADRKLEEVLKNLSTFYRDESFTSDDFQEQFDAIVNETDLSVLDHFHYVDEGNEDTNRSAKKTVKQIRDCTLRGKKPVIVVAHIRKGDRKNTTLIPGQDDFHGSSDIPKIATKAVMIAPAYNIPSPKPYLWPTYMAASKNRTDMSTTRYVAVVMFNTRQNAYEDDYTLGRLTDAGQKFAPLEENEMPPWANPSAEPEQKGFSYANQ